MAKGWKGESRRHSLASKGVKTAVKGKPLAKVVVKQKHPVSRQKIFSFLKKKDVSLVKWFESSRVSGFGRFSGGDKDGYGISVSKSSDFFDDFRGDLIDTAKITAVYSRESTPLNKNKLLRTYQEAKKILEKNNFVVKDLNSYEGTVKEKI